MSKPSGSTSYRDPKVEEDEDDLDDLDDVLASFNAQPAAPAPGAAAPTARPQAAPSSGGVDAEDDDEDFEASLVEGMESLLRQLAGDHPPGPMPDLGEGEVQLEDKAKSPSASAATGAARGKAKGLSAEEEEAAWQKAIDTLLSGEGLSALGLEDKKGKSRAGPAPPRPAAGASASATAAGRAAAAGAMGGANFEETIRKTMESLKAGGEGSKGSANGKAAPDLAELLKQLSENPGALDGLGDEDEDGDDPLGGLLDGMMSQLMTKEILEEPMSELASKYPAYLASPPSTASKADLEKYQQQYTLVQRILETFRKEGYSDEKDGKEIARLVGEMQDLGGPPLEIMGDLPEGFDLGALGGGEDGCCIM